MLSSIMGSSDNKSAELQLEAQICATIFQLTNTINIRLEKATSNLPPCRYIDEGLIFIFSQFSAEPYSSAHSRANAKPARLFWGPFPANLRPSFKLSRQSS
eukprot:UN02612